MKLPGIVALAVLLAACSPPVDPGPATVATQPLASPAAPGSMAPRLALDAQGQAVLSWLEPVTDFDWALKYATLQQDGWSVARQLAYGADWFVNWADFPAVMPIDGDTWAAYWLVHSADATYAYDIRLALSTDAGASWPVRLTPHDDGTRTEHGFVSLFGWDGEIGAVWLDGRNMRPDDGSSGHASGNMSLRYARLDAAGTISESGEIDAMVCDCCQTSVAVAAGGPVLAYRGRTPDEIRDILVTRYEDGRWLPPVVLGNDQWRIPGCPVNGPAVAARGDRVAVAWYAAPDRQARVAVAFSDDGGRSFSVPVIVDQGMVSGRVAIRLAEDDAALVSWLGRAADGTGQLRLRRVLPEGASGPIQVIAEGDVSRGSGFPQMIDTADGLVFAWTEPGEPSRILTARLNASRSGPLASLQ
jgi:hypothetical protein